MNAARLRRVAERICSALGFKIIPRYQWATINRLLSGVLSSEVASPGAGSSGPLQIEGVVFSKDRPLQLAATLGSFLDQMHGAGPLQVLYAASSLRYERAYEELQSEFGPPKILWQRETSFRLDLVRLLASIRSSTMFFLVDDIVFVEPVAMAELAKLDPQQFIVSLRLGKNLDYCYMASSKQRLPTLESLGGSVPLLSWKWCDGDWDWGYPLSLDGHFFSTSQLRVMASLTEYSAPNSFEGSLQAFSGVFECLNGVCYEKSRLVNIPHNKVQSENRNRSQGHSAEDLLRAWEEGYRIDFQSLYGFNNRSAHEEVPLRLVRR